MINSYRACPPPKKFIKTSRQPNKQESLEDWLKLQWVSPKTRKAELKKEMDGLLDTYQKTNKELQL